jgi:hypothetical protein
MRGTTAACCCALGLVLCSLSGGAERESGNPDEQLLRSANVATDGPGLLAFFRQRTLTDANRAYALALIRQLGNRSFRARERASVELVRLGPLAAPLLREAMRGPDLEAARRAENCLREIENASDAALVAAATRLLSARRPAGSVAVLLDYLPGAPDSGTAMEVQTALAALAVRHGKADEALVAGLRDGVAIRRAAAAEALCQAGAAEHLPAVRKLLHDPEAHVRLRVALALAYRREKEAIPVLIDLLAALPPDARWQAEVVLQQLAGAHAPLPPPEADAAARGRYRDAWAAWWRVHEGEVDLAVLRQPPRFLGYTLIVLLDSGRVIELGADRKPRLEIGGLQSPLDAQVLPGERLLIAEHGRGVTERGRGGEVLWHKDVTQPIGAQRLPNGNTFIATRSQLLEVDRSGKPVFSIVRPDNSFISARKLVDGRVGCVSGGRFLVLDTAGKEVKSFDVGNVQTTSSLDVLPNGHVVVAQYGNHKLVEFDSNGKLVWEASVPSPISAMRLPNGHTLTTSHQGPKQVIELDEKGKVVWDYAIAGHATRARQR